MYTCGAPVVVCSHAPTRRRLGGVNLEPSAASEPCATKHRKPVRAAALRSFTTPLGFRRKIMRFGRLLTVIGFALPLYMQGAASAQAQTFKIEEGGESRIQFVSDAPLEKFTGTSAKVTGDIKVDPNKPADTKAEIKV